MRIGNRSGRRPFLTPANKGMTARVNERLEHMVAASNVQAAEAIKVDGVQFLLWQRTPSSTAGISGRTCSCHGGHAPAASAITGDTNHSEVDQVNIDDDVAPNNNAGYRILGLPTFNDSATSQVTDPRAKVVTENIHNKGTPIDDDAWNNEDEAQEWDSADKYAVDDNGRDAHRDFETLRAFLSGGEATAEPGVLGAKPTTSVGVACPVCCTATYVEAWQPYGGKRLVFSFLDSDSWESDGFLDTNTAPYTMRLAEGQQLTFRMKLPLYFTSVIRVGMWNGRFPLDSATIGLRLINETTGEDVLADPQAVLASSGSGQTLTFSLVAKSDIMLTHFDVVLMLRELPFAQFPTLNTPYELDMLEYMTNIAIECTADTYAAPGNIVSDFKFRKCWRVTNSVHKFTAGGKSMVLQVDLQAVNSHEPFFALHPFAVPQEQGSDRFSGILESSQGRGNFSR